MPDIHIHRQHTLGLPKARKLAHQWIEDAKSKFALEYTVVQDKTHDLIEFSRAGLEGTMRVEADQLTIDAKLGFLFGAMSKQIEAQIAANVDALLAKR